MYRICAFFIILGLISSARTASKDDDIEELRETIRTIQVFTILIRFMLAGLLYYLKCTIHNRLTNILTKVPSHDILKPLLFTFTARIAKSEKGDWGMTSSHLSIDIHLNLDKQSIRFHVSVFVCVFVCLSTCPEFKKRLNKLVLCWSVANGIKSFPIEV